MKLGLDLLRHAFAVAVIIQHMASSRYSPDTLTSLRNTIDWIDGAVAGFFFVSGCLSREQSAIALYARRQTIRLLTPFFAFSLIYAFSLALLGKSELTSGLTATITLHGAGMQLYFLPFLLLISVAHAALTYATPRLRSRAAMMLAITALTAVCLWLPTKSSTGADVKLIPYYYLSFLLGCLYQTALRHNALAVMSAFVAPWALAGLADPRFFDLAGVIALAIAADRVSAHLPQRRIPGSGGTYLLHTPIVNFSFSVMLLGLGITEDQNIWAAVALTYVACLGATWLFVRALPRHRWLILE